MIRKVVCPLLLTLTLATLTGCSATGFTKDNSVVANAESANSQLSPAEINDPEINQYFQAISQRILVTAKKLDAAGVGPAKHLTENTQWMFSPDIQFHLVNSKTINAFTTGGHHLYIYNGLFQLCKSEDELAAVMAHEYGHVYSRHVQKGTDRSYLQMGAVGAAALGGYAYGGQDSAAQAQQLGGTAAQFLGMGFTRNDENEADKFGFMFYTHAGWDPTHFADFFKRMISMGLDSTPEMMSDHPKLAARVENTNRRVSELSAKAPGWRQPPIADPAKLAHLQQRAQSLSASQPTSESLQKAQTLLASFSSCVSPAEGQPEQQAVRAKMTHKAK